MSKESRGDGNEGIIAGSVNAQVLAVGRQSKATLNVSSGSIEQFQSFVTELKKVIEELKIPHDAKALMSEHVIGLESEATKSAPDRGRVEGALKALSSSAKLLGEFVSNAKIILGPIAKIAALFGFAIP